MRRFWTITLVGTCLAVSGANLLGPCAGSQRRMAALRGFSSPWELRSFLAQQAKARYQNRGGWGSRDFLDGGMPGLGLAMPLMAPNAMDDASEANGDAGGGDYSTTNIQEAGVDESDIVKNDGNTIYVLAGDTIHIVQATPPEGVTELATVEIESSGDSLYLRGDELIALSQRYVYFEPSEEVIEFLKNSPEVQEFARRIEALMEDFAVLEAMALYQDVMDFLQEHPELEELASTQWYDGWRTTVTVIDVSDPAQPEVEATIGFESQLATSRLIDNRLHLVMTTIPRLSDWPFEIALDFMTVDQWLPDYTVADGQGNVLHTGDMVIWQDVFRPDDPDGYGITTVVTLDLDDPTGEFESTAVTADAGVIYASTQALYVSDTGYDWSSFGSRVDTAIHKLTFTESGTDYVASGIVPGRPLNQYSLGEHEGYLRIATTTQDASTWTPTNNVYVLGESDILLEVVGSIENIAPGEEIYAARFIGDRGFLVTFYRIDPLFTLNLSDPKNPRRAGELKVPGYSDHIQLMDENHLLTIGKDAQDAGDWAWVQGVQLSIFDVSNLANPQLKHKEIIGGRGTDSEANRNPKAFNYFAAADALAFPIDLYSAGTDGPEWGRHEFTGLYVYRVTVEGGFEFLGGIPSAEDTQNLGCYWGYWGFTRGVFIGDTVYSATQGGVKAASLDDLGTISGWTEFDDAEPPWDDCWYWDEPVLILPVGDGIR